MVEREPPDEREMELLGRLHRFYLSAGLGHYFRGRVHGWLALHSGLEVELPAELLARLGREGGSARLVPSVQTPEQLAVDAFAMAYHVSETFCRQLLAVLNGAGPRSSPALALKSLPTGRSFTESLEALVETEARLNDIADFVFLPPEVRANLPEETVVAQRTLVRHWIRHHVRRLEEWKNPNNAFKHGLAATAPITQMAFVSEPEDEGATAYTLMHGPVLHTLEHEDVRLGDGSKFKKLSWWHRAVDPMELVADVLTTADLLDWLLSVARGRLLGEPVMVPVMIGPLPSDLRTPGPPGISFRLDFEALPMALADEDVERMSGLLDAPGAHVEDKVDDQSAEPSGGHSAEDL